MSDFGLSDPYVGQMKASILSFKKDIQIIDLTHFIPAQSIDIASRVLEASWSYFPKGSIHLAVIDPGVGSDRDQLLAFWKGHYFIAPDNGILSFLPEEAEVWKLPKKHAFLRHSSATFEGRDVFAKMAGALIIEGYSFYKSFSRAVDIKRLLKTPHSLAGISQPIRSSIFYFDHFGNALLALKDRELSHLEGLSEAAVEISSHHLPIKRCYNDVRVGEALALFNSLGYLELAVNQGSAREVLNLEVGQTATLKYTKA